MFQVERQTTNGYWYDVMMSPFETLQDVFMYLEKYSKYYPVAERIYKITQQTYEKNTCSY